MDIYKTRYGEEWRIIPRQCPVDASGKSPEFQGDGFKVYKDSIRKEVKESAMTIIDENKDNLYFNYEPDGLTVRSILGVHKHIMLEDIVPDSVVQEIKSILGGEFYIHQSRVNVKTKGSGSGWTPHSDFETWHYDDGMEKMRCLTVMIPLDINRVENGCLEVIRGSHHHYFSDKYCGDFGHDDNFTDQKAGVVVDDACNMIADLCGSNWEPIELNVGDALIFDCNLLHRSLKNNSTYDRTNLFFVLNSVENKLKAPFSGGEPRPLEMATR